MEHWLLGKDVKGFFRCRPLDMTINNINNEIDNGDEKDRINYVFDDSLLLEIFKRLPWSWVVQCKPVCKRWYSLISESLQYTSFSWPYSFILQLDLEATPLKVRYPLLSSANIPLYDKQAFFNFTEHPDPHCKLHSSKFDFLPFVDKERLRSFHLVISHQELLICRERPSVNCTIGYTAYEGNTVYYLCDPLKKWFVELPPAPSKHCVETSYGIAVLREENSMRYVMVCVQVLDFSDEKKESFLIDLYCSEMRKWRTINVTLPEGKRFRISNIYFKFNSNAVSFNNNLHWVDDEFVLVYDPFNAAMGNTCRLMDVPIPWLPESATQTLGISGGHMWLAQLRDDRPYYTLIVWKLENYNSGIWGLEHHTCLLKMRFLGSDPRLTSLKMNVLGCCRYCDDTTSRLSKNQVMDFHPIDPQILFLSYGHLIVRCDFTRRTIRQITSCSAYDNQIRHVKFFPLLHPSTDQLMKPPYSSP